MNPAADQEWRDAIAGLLLSPPNRRTRRAGEDDESPIGFDPKQRARRRRRSKIARVSRRRNR